MVCLRYESSRVPGNLICILTTYCRSCNDIAFPQDVSSCVPGRKSSERTIHCKHDTCTVFRQNVSSCDSDTLRCQRIMWNIHYTWTDSLKGGSSCVPDMLKCNRTFDCTRCTCVSFQKWEPSSVPRCEYFQVYNPYNSHHFSSPVAAENSQWRRDYSR